MNRYTAPLLAALVLGCASPPPVAEPPAVEVNPYIREGVEVFMTCPPYGIDVTEWGEIGGFTVKIAIQSQSAYEVPWYEDEIHEMVHKAWESNRDEIMETPPGGYLSYELYPFKVALEFKPIGDPI